MIVGLVMVGGAEGGGDGGGVLLKSNIFLYILVFRKVKDI